MVKEKNNKSNSMMLSGDILRATSECIAVISLDYRYIQFNTAFLEAFDDTAESLFNTHISERVGEEVFSRLLKPALDRCFAGEKISLQYWRKLPTSGMRFLDVRYDPLIDELGRVIGAVSGVRDITDIIHGEESTRYSDARFKDFAETAADWFWETNSNDYYTFVSERFEQITGVPTADVIGRNLNEVLPDVLKFTSDSRQGQQDFLDRKHFQVTYTLNRSDGEFRIITLSGKPKFSRDLKFMGYRGTGRDITDAYQLSKRLKFQASHDTLTGLINRREFERQLRICCEESEKNQESHVLCYMDLDQFKLINDTCGHVAGDELLRILARLLRSQLDENDVIARLGGDEFGVLYRNTTLDDARRKANQLCRITKDFQFNWEELRFSVGVSIGVILISGCDQEFTQLLKQADLACYLAKELGRDQVYIVGEDDELEARRFTAMKWIAQIDEAFSRDKFILYAQPIIDVLEPDSEKSWCEILIRMHVNDQIVLPGEFLPAAEKYGRIVAIDRWVIDNTFQWISKSLSRQQNRIYSINISAHSVCDLGLVNWLLERIKNYSIDARCLCFEITETSDIRDMDAADKFIAAVHSLGCKVALDDFGKGMSSFDYLKELNIDVIKLYGGFVKSMAEDRVDYLSVKAITEFGLALGKTVIAENVFSEAVLHETKKLGIRYVQGYYLSEPVPLVGIE